MKSIILGSLDTFLEGASSDLRLGRLSASAGLLQALLQYGTFREFQIFCPTVAERQTLNGLLQTAGLDTSRLRLRLQAELPDAMKVGEIGLFHSAGWSRYLPGLARLRAHLSPKAMPLTGLIHSIDGPDMPLKLGHLLRAPFLSCDAVFCSSSAGKAAFERELTYGGQHFPGRLPELPLGIGDAFFREMEQASARQRIGLPADEFIFLWLGRLSASTKADLGPLLYAFRRVRTDGRKLRLLLSGGDDPGSRDAYLNMAAELGIADRVTVAADPTDEERRDLYAAADVFVSPVDNCQETFGLAVVEAMAAGLPCIVSDWDGYRDLVVEGETGFRLPTCALPGSEFCQSLQEVLDPPLAGLLRAQAVAVDVASLASRMELLAGDAQLSRRLGDKGREVAHARFHWQAVILRLETIWMELLEQAKSCPLERKSLWSMDPAAFDGYPTRTLSEADVLALSDDARAVLAGALPMSATWTDLGPVADGRLMTRLVRALSGGPASVSALCEDAGRMLGADPERTRWMILWLMKYGLLQRESGNVRR